MKVSQCVQLFASHTVHRILQSRLLEWVAIPFSRDLPNQGLAMNAGITLHIRVLYGKNTHHIIEAIFKGFARALAEAVAFDSRVQGVMSSKGLL